MNASDIMTPNPICVRTDAPLLDAIRIMLDNHVSGVPVTDAAQNLVGMLTEGDLLQRMEIGTEQRPGWLQLLLSPGSAAAAYVRGHGRRVAELMTPDVVSVSESTSLEDIVFLMRKRRIRRVPVTRDGALVGIVTRADLVKALSRALRAPTAEAMGDEEIRDEVLAELNRQRWAPKGIRINVSEGRVDLDGVIFDERDRVAIRVAAENVPGVKSVTDHLVWVDPNSAMVYAPEADETPEVGTSR